MIGNRNNFDDTFMRDLTVCVLANLESQIRWVNKFQAGDVFVDVPIYYSMVGDERFLLDSFQDDIVNENRYVELNTDIIPRGHLTLTSFNIRSDEISNPNVWLKTVVEDDYEIKKVLRKIRAVPVSVMYDLDIILSSELDTFKCSQALMDTLLVYKFMYFEHNFMSIDAVILMPDNNSVEISREKNMSSDNNIKLKVSFQVDTYYPAYKKYYDNDLTPPKPDLTENIDNIIVTLTHLGTSDNPETLLPEIIAHCLITPKPGFNVLESGFVWSKDLNPDKNDDSIYNKSNDLEFDLTFGELEYNTKYFVRAWAYTPNLGYVYSEQLSITTNKSDVNGDELTGVQVITTDLSNITDISVDVRANLLIQPNIEIDTIGVCWDISNDPTIENSYTETIFNGLTSSVVTTYPFIEYVDNLDPDTIYYIRAYARNEDGIAYGNIFTFKSTNESLPPEIWPPSPLSGNKSNWNSGDNTSPKRTHWYSNIIKNRRRL